MVNPNGTENKSVTETLDQPELLAKGFWLCVSVLVIFWIFFVAKNSIPSWRLEGPAFYDAWAAYYSPTIPLSRFTLSMSGYITGVPYLLSDNTTWFTLRFFSCLLLFGAGTYFTWTLTKLTKSTEFTALLATPFLYILTGPMLNAEVTCFTLMLLASACFLRRQSAANAWPWSLFFSLFVNLAAIAYLPVLFISIPVTLLSFNFSKSSTESYAILAGALFAYAVIVACFCRNYMAADFFALSTFSTISTRLWNYTEILQELRFAAVLQLTCYVSTCYLIGTLILKLFQFSRSNSRISQILSTEASQILITLTSISVLVVLIPITIVWGHNWNLIVPWWLEHHSGEPFATILLFVASCLLPLSLHLLKSTGLSKDISCVPLMLLVTICWIFQSVENKPASSVFSYLGPVFFTYFFTAVHKATSLTNKIQAYRLLVVAAMTLYFFFSLYLFGKNTLHQYYGGSRNNNAMFNIRASKNQVSFVRQARELYGHYGCSDATFAALDDLPLVYYLFQRRSPFIVASQAFYLPEVKNLLASSSKVCLFYRRLPDLNLPLKPASMVEILGVSKINLSAYQDILIEETDVAFLHFEKFQSPT